MSFLDNLVFEDDSDAHSIELFVTARTAANVQIQKANCGNCVINRFVPARETVKIVIPTDWAHGHAFDGSDFRSLLITSTAPIRLFALNNMPHSTDASLILPEDALGHEYIASTHTPPIFRDPESGQLFAYPSVVLVVATEDNTVVTFSNMPDRGNLQRTLQAGETFNVASVDNLTGTRVVSADPCKPIAVFAGQLCANVYVDCTRCDHIFEQVYPNSTLGQSFLLSPFGLGVDAEGFSLVQQNGYLISLLAQEPNTTAFVNGQRYALQAGRRVEVPVNNFSHSYITADRPLAVTQFMLGQECNGLPVVTEDETGNGFLAKGDPSMMYQVPTEQTIGEVTFSTVTTENLTDHFVNIVTRAEWVDQILLDGQNVATAAFVQNPFTTEWVAATLKIANGSHTIESRGNARFLAYAYGVGVRESYGYTAGATFNNLSLNIDLALQTDNPTLNNIFTDTLCLNQSVEFTAEANVPIARTRWEVEGQAAVEVEGSSYSQRFGSVGTFDLRLTAFPADGNCREIVTNKQITVVDVPKPVLPETIIACQGERITLDPQITDGDFSWNTGENSPSITVTESGTYTLTHISATCLTSVSSLVTFLDGASADLDEKYALCEGESIDLLLPAGGGLDYRWEDENGNTISTDRNLNISSAGAYKAVVISEACTSVSPFSIETYALPRFELPTSIALCDGEVYQTRLPEDFSYNCFNESGDLVSQGAALSLGQAGNYTIEATSSEGCVFIQQITLQFEAIEQLPENIELSACIGETISYTAPEGYDTYYWPDLDRAQATVSFTESGEYTLSASLGNCTVQTAVFVSFEGLPSGGFGIEADENGFCAPQTIRFSIDDFQETYTYLWEAGDGSSEREIADNQGNWSHTYPLAGDFSATLSIRTPLGCEERLSLPLSVNLPPTAAFEASPALCLGAPLTPKNLSDSSETLDFYWEIDGYPELSGTLPAPSFFLPEAGTYSLVLIVSDANGCRDSTATAVEVFDLPIANIAAKDEASTLYVAEGENLTVAANPTSNTWEYRWLNSSGEQIADGERFYPEISSDTTFYLEVGNSAGCISVDTVTIIYFPAPLTLDVPPICAGESFTATAKVSGRTATADLTFSWFDEEEKLLGNGDTFTKMSPIRQFPAEDSTIVLKLAVSMDFEQKKRYDFPLLATHVTIYPLPTTGINLPDTVCFDDLNNGLQLPESSQDFMEAVWYRQSPTGLELMGRAPVHTDDTGEFLLELTDSRYPTACQQAFSFTVVEVCPAGIYFPTAFRPDSPHEQNRVFGPKGRFFTAYELLIFNRWGEVIFSSRDPNDHWDGTFGGKRVPSGSYTYFCQYTSELLPRERFQITGKVSLLR